MFFPYYFDRTILLVLVGMAIVGWAQWRVSHVYKKNQALYTQKGETGAQIARRLLDNAGLHDVPIEVIGGRMSDHYDPRSRVLRLSQEVASRATAASIGIAAHEVGHAIQHAQRYAADTGLCDGARRPGYGSADLICIRHCVSDHYAAGGAQRIQPGQGADLSNGRLYAGGAKWRQPDAQRCRYDLFGFHIFGAAAIFKIAADYTK